MGQWPSGDSPWLGARRQGSNPRPHLDTELCVLVRVCVVVCVSRITRSDTPHLVSPALSLISMGAQKSYITPQSSCTLKKNVEVIKDHRRTDGTFYNGRESNSLMGTRVL